MTHEGRIALNLNGPGDQTIWPAEASARVGLVMLIGDVSIDCHLTFKAGSRLLSGPITMLAAGSINLDFIETLIGELPAASCWFIAEVGEALILNIDNGANFAGFAQVTLL